MDITTQNGTEITIVPASTKSVFRLKREVIRHLKNKGFIDEIGNGNISGLKLSSVLDLIVDIDSSEEFEKAIFECLKVCIYDANGKRLKITEQLFDDIPEAREEYYEIMTKCAEVNLRPFFKSLFTEFSNRLQTIPVENQEQE